MLNKDFILNKWLPALRSGSYNQTKELLRDNSGYCCLGVACDLLGLEWLDAEEVLGIQGLGDADDINYMGNDPYHYYVMSSDYDEVVDTELPPVAINTIGFATGDSIDLPDGVFSVPLIEEWLDKNFNDVAILPYAYYTERKKVRLQVYPGRTSRVNLAALNDEGMNFEQIANVVEQIVRMHEEAETEAEASQS